MKSKTNLLLIFSFLVIGFQNCGQKFESLAAQESVSLGSEGTTDSSGLPPDDGEMPTSENPPPDVTPTEPISNLPAAVELAEYLPKIPDSQCEPKTPIIDPFKKFTMNKKTVCESGCTYADLGEAISKAKAFDEIEVAPGEYKGCFVLKTSPLILRGVGGLATLDSRACRTGFYIDSENIKISNFRIFGQRRVVGAQPTRGIAIEDKVKFAQLQGLWIEGKDSAISGHGTNATIIIKDFKIKNVGYSWGDKGHRAGVINSSPSVLIIARGTFSHHRVESWLFRSDSPRIEFLCNVSLRSTGDDGRSGHISTRYMRFAGNYFQRNPGYTDMFYQYKAQAGTEYIFENNMVVFDHPDGNLFNVPRLIKLTTANNIIVGGWKKWGYGWPLIDLTTNQYFSSREAAGMPPFPEVPPQFPVEKY